LSAPENWMNIDLSGDNEKSKHEPTSKTRDDAVNNV